MTDGNIFNPSVFYDFLISNTRSVQSLIFNRRGRQPNAVRCFCRRRREGFVRAQEKRRAPAAGGPGRTKPDGRNAAGTPEKFSKKFTLCHSVIEWCGILTS